MRNSRDKCIEQRVRRLGIVGEKWADLEAAPSGTNVWRMGTLNEFPRVVGLTQRSVDISETRLQPEERWANRRAVKRDENF